MEVHEGYGDVGDLDLSLIECGDDCLPFYGVDVRPKVLVGIPQIVTHYGGVWCGVVIYQLLEGSPTGTEHGPCELAFSGRPANIFFGEKFLHSVDGGDHGDFVNLELVHSCIDDLIGQFGGVVDKNSGLIVVVYPPIQLPECHFSTSDVKPREAEAGGTSSHTIFVQNTRVLPYHYKGENIGDITGLVPSGDLLKSELFANLVV